MTLAAIFRFIKCAQTEERGNFKRCSAGLHMCLKMVFEIRVSGITDIFVKLSYWPILPTDLPAQSHLQFNLSKPTGHVIHQQFKIQQLYALPTVYLCVLYLSENKQRLVPLTA